MRREGRIAMCAAGLTPENYRKFFLGEFTARKKIELGFLGIPELKDGIDKLQKEKQDILNQIQHTQERVRKAVDEVRREVISELPEEYQKLYHPFLLKMPNIKILELQEQENKLSEKIRAIEVIITEKTKRKLMERVMAEGFDVELEEESNTIIVK